MKANPKTAYRPESFIRWERDARMRLLATRTHAVAQSLPSTWLNREFEEIIGSVPEYPKALRTTLRGYAQALRDLIDREDIGFMYEVEGKLYAITETNRRLKSKGWDELPGWDNLPEKEWPNLYKHGSLRWLRTGAVFYKGETDETEEG